mmetsp:Transcript_37158/g.82541  ORF Transcript_37158/g.82541 Transcript_37158/m.82541 type:complete len:203 (+) Transcript_37158:1291-1899(+)
MQQLGLALGGEVVAVQCPRLQSKGRGRCGGEYLLDLDGHGQLGHHHVLGHDGDRSGVLQEARAPLHVCSELIVRTAARGQLSASPACRYGEVRCVEVSLDHVHPVAPVRLPRHAQAQAGVEAHHALRAERQVPLGAHERGVEGAPGATEQRAEQAPLLRDLRLDALGLLKYVPLSHVAQSQSEAGERPHLAALGDGGVGAVR